MNIQQLATFQAVMAQLARERKQARANIELRERIADWRQQNVLWSELHKRYRLAVIQNDYYTAKRLYWVLLAGKVRWEA
jgi:hypothetical protein